jgi:cell division protein FtsZ
MGIGTAKGDDRALNAAEQAISSPLLETSIMGAKGILLSITGSSDIRLLEITEAAKIISESADPDANIIFGAVIDESLGDTIRVTVIATGFDAPSARDNLRITKELDVRPFTDAPIDIPAFLRRGK